MISFSNWIIQGCGETYGGTAQFPNLINPDSDNDGLLDSEDPYPLYPFKPIINFGNLDFDTNSITEFNKLVWFKIIDIKCDKNMTQRNGRWIL